MTFSKIPIENLPPAFRQKVERVEALGGDPSFFQFAANANHIVEFYWTHFYGDVFFSGILPVRIKELVRLRLTLHSGCNFCQIGDSASAVKHGVSPDEIQMLLDPGQDLNFLSATEQAAMKFADLVASSQPVTTIDTELHDELTAHFSDSELVELFTIIGVLTGMGRMLVASGFVQASCAMSSVPSAETKNP